MPRGRVRLIHSTAQARKICLPAAGASSSCALVVAPCAFSHMVVIFRGRRNGKPRVLNLVLQSRLFATGARNRSCLLLRGRCSTLDMVVIVEEIRFRAANRDFWTCGSFADFVRGRHSTL